MAELKNILRNRLFWTLDAFREIPVRKDLLDVSQILNQGVSPPPSLDTLLSHAVATTSFYKGAQPYHLDSFPVINKSIIRENVKGFVSSKYLEKDLIPVITSGSTGTPFKVFHHQRKKTRNTADTLYFAGLVGFKPGHRLAYLKIWAKEKMASPFQYWIKNVIPVDVIHLNDEQIEGLIRTMEEDRLTYGILGYVSAMELVCRYLDRSGKEKVDASVNSIISMSESLNDYVRVGMEKYFGSKVYSRYSNLENGIIAQQVPGSEHRFLINTASYIVETLRINDDKPSEPHEAGRIVITDLFNFAMPMIRYDTGDIGILSPRTGEQGNRYFESIEGRKMDMLYDTRGNIVSSYIMYKNMWKYTEIKQYQLIQKGKDRYVLKINADPDYNRDCRIIEEFKLYLGFDADFSIDYVTEIPLLSSGKRRKLINEMIE